MDEQVKTDTNCLQPFTWYVSVHVNTCNFEFFFLELTKQETIWFRFIRNVVL